MNITLIYFDFPFWRAEVSRISLFLSNTEFEDKRITSEEFQRVKENGVLDDGTVIHFHQLPCLKVNDISIAQTGAISRFCGKISNLYPKNDDLLAGQIDQFIAQRLHQCRFTPIRGVLCLTDFFNPNRP